MTQPTVLCCLLRVVVPCAFSLSLLLAGGCSKPESAARSESGETTTVTLPIEGMSCSACAARVKEALGTLPGVAGVEVDLGKRQARVRVARTLAPQHLVRAVNELGYRAGEPITLP